jgi:putative methyltransferase (TIGR04325 family)
MKPHRAVIPMKKFLLEIVPPLVLRWIMRIFHPYGFFGDYATWKEASKYSTSYDSDLIVNKVRDAIRKVRDGEAVFERDSVLFERIEYSWFLLSGLLWVASVEGNRLNLVDFGGSLGSTYYQNRPFLIHLEEIKWGIVEQEKFVECGKREFENEHVNFFSTLEDCVAEQRPNTILLGSVLQFVEEPYHLLEKITELAFQYVIIDRTPFLCEESDRITSQRIPPSVYDASIPAWLLNYGKMVSHLSRNFDVIAEYERWESMFYNRQELPLKGFILRKK